MLIGHYGAAGGTGHVHRGLLAEARGLPAGMFLLEGAEILLCHAASRVFF